MGTHTSAAEGLAQRRAYHVIPVPRGWSVEQAWEAISRGDLLTDPHPAWASVYTEGGRFVRALDVRTEA